MKKLLLSMAVLACTLCGTAQATAQEAVDVQAVEFELFGGINRPIGGYHNSDRKTGAALGLELRYNLPSSKVDVGLMFSLHSIQRDFVGDPDNPQGNRTATIALTGDYNFMQGKKVNPFVGAAFGFVARDVINHQYNTVTDDYASYPDDNNGVIFRPRVGVELVHHIRISTGLELTRRGWNDYFLTLGVVIGGRPHKKK